MTTTVQYPNVIDWIIYRFEASAPVQDEGDARNDVRREIFERAVSGDVNMCDSELGAMMLMSHFCGEV